MSEPVKVAVITGAHGLKGAVRVHILHSDALEALSAWKDAAGNAQNLAFVRDDGPNDFIARLANIADRTAAERLKGTAFYAAPGALPKLKSNEFYASQLIGLSVVTPEGTKVAIVKSVENFGAGDILTLSFNDGKEELFPFTHAFFGEVQDNTIKFYVPVIEE